MNSKKKERENMDTYGITHEMLAQHNCEWLSSYLDEGRLFMPYGADLRGVNFRGMNLACASLARTDMSGADLSGVDLTRNNLSGAKLRGAKLCGAKLYSVNLSDSDLTGADFTGAEIFRVDLARAKLTGATFTDAIVDWNSNDLVAELIFRAAGKDRAKRKMARLFLENRNLFWDRFLSMGLPLTSWVLEVLAPYVRDGDNAPKILRQL
jgi:hypothetical protein